jgi:hypothetical protein
MNVFEVPTGRFVVRRLRFWLIPITTTIQFFSQSRLRLPISRLLLSLDPSGESHLILLSLVKTNEVG